MKPILKKRSKQGAAYEGKPFKVDDLHHMTANQLSRLFGVSHQSVVKWTCPRLPDSHYDLVHVLAWRIDKADEERDANDDDTGRDNKSADQRRVLKARAIKLEIENEITRGNLVRLDEVEHQWTRVLARLRQEMLRIPAAVESECGADVSAAVDKRIRATLTNMARDYDKVREK